MQNPPRLPTRKQRITIVGRTGTGKTVAAMWHLSNMPLDSMPFVLFDFKGDEHLNSIPHLQEIDYTKVPKKKDHGIFILHPLPQEAERPRPNEPSDVEKYIWRLWERENVGIVCDEGYMMGNNKAFEAVLTQGRSKRMPMIICAQRPAWLSRFVFSEADFFQVFHLNDERDRKTVQAFVPKIYEGIDTLKEHHSFYYDVGKNRLDNFGPVPSPKEIHDIFDEKLEKRRRWL